jgi:hypothetical protein
MEAADETTEERRMKWERDLTSHLSPLLLRRERERDAEKWLCCEAQKVVPKYLDRTNLLRRIVPRG